MREILVKSIMTPLVSGLSGDTSLADAIKLMSSKRYSCMLVTDKNTPVGILTERDMVRLTLATAEQSSLLETPINAEMSSPVITLNQNDSLFDALVVSRAQHVRHLPVVDDNNILVGLITQSDLVNAHFKVVELQSQIIENSIKEKTRELSKANEELQALSMEDHLLDIGNRRSMEVDLQHTHAAAKRYQRDYALVLLDIDFFKGYNDHYGHAAGDETLRLVSETIKSHCRESDRLYRYGGEEILMILPETSLDDAILMAQRLIKSLEEREIPHCKSPLGYVSVSAGIGQCHAGGRFPEHWKFIVEQADKGLNEAKQTGRNRVGVFNRQNAA